MPFTLPELPYAKDALAPHISAETLEYHYGKHHQTYVTKLNELIAGSAHEGKDLVSLVRASEGGIFNNAAQIYNHTFYWNCMKNGGGGVPSGALAQRIETDFGSFDSFRRELTQAAVTLFGSGWAWVVLDDGRIKIEQGPNAATPISTGKTPLLTIDVWEHAYYIDFRNARPKYVETFLDHLVNWEFVAGNL